MKNVWKTALSGALCITVVALTGCSSTQTSESTTPEVKPAQYCSDLMSANEDALQASEAWYRNESQLDESWWTEILRACDSEPALSVNEAIAAVALEGSSSADPTGLAVLADTYTVTDEDGYTFELKVSYALQQLAQDPASEKPNFTAAVPAITLALDITNTTQQRDLAFEEQSGVTSPLDRPTFLLSAVFAQDSPVCAEIPSSQTFVEMPTGCEWYLGGGRLTNVLTLPADGSLSLTTFAGIPAGGSVAVGGIPEASYAALEPLLTSPDGYRVRYVGGDMSRFSSPCDANYTKVLVSTVPC